MRGHLRRQIARGIAATRRHYDQLTCAKLHGVSRTAQIRFSGHLPDNCDEVLAKGPLEQIFDIALLLLRPTANVRKTAISQSAGDLSCLRISICNILYLQRADPLIARPPWIRSIMLQGNNCSLACFLGRPLYQLETRQAKTDSEYHPTRSSASLRDSVAIERSLRYSTSHFCSCSQPSYCPYEFEQLY